MSPGRCAPILLLLLLQIFVPKIIPGGELALAANPWSEQAKLSASNGEVLDVFAFSAALSADGNVAIVGAKGRNSGQGAAYIFTRSGTTWVERAELTDSSGGAHHDFGYSVAISADGGTALVGARGKNTGRGAAFIFTGSGSSWSLQAELTASDGAAMDDFGISVALSDDGNTALVGAEGKNSAYVFTRNGTDWSQTEGALTPSDGEAGDHFGFSVALSADGDTALIGAIGKNSGQGKAYLFTRSDSAWGGEVELTAADGSAGDGFGVSVGLDANGATALIGASGRNDGQGAAYIFTGSGSTWAQQGGALTAHDGVASDDFGFAVALSADGNTAMIGADNRTSSQGAAYVFTHFYDVWREESKIAAGFAADGDYFGHSVGISDDGSTALCGAIGADGWKGSLYLFAHQPLTPSIVTAAPITDITSVSGTGGGNVTDDGGSKVTAMGVCWGAAVNPTTADSCTDYGSGIGLFTSSISGLFPATTYHVRAYATNAVGTAYGDDVTFSTNAVLSVTVPGPGAGSVHFSSPDFNCSSGTCERSYPYGSSVTLTPVAGDHSLFGGWQGSCSNPSGDCVLTMDANRAVQADFVIDPVYGVWNDPGTIYYSSIFAAYQDAVSGVTSIKACQLELKGDINFNLGKSIKLSGGYDSSYLTNIGFTTVKGGVTVSTGDVTVDRLIIR
jgi:hypothetical protein